MSEITDEKTLPPVRYNQCPPTARRTANRPILAITVIRTFFNRETVMLVAFSKGDIHSGEEGPGFNYNHYQF